MTVTIVLGARGVVVVVCSIVLSLSLCESCHPTLHFTTPAIAIQLLGRVKIKLLSVHATLFFYWFVYKLLTVHKRVNKVAFLLSHALIIPAATPFKIVSNTADPRLRRRPLSKSILNAVAWKSSSSIGSWPAFPVTLDTKVSVVLQSCRLGAPKNILKKDLIKVQYHHILRTNIITKCKTIKKYSTINNSGIYSTRTDLYGSILSYSWICNRKRIALVKFSRKHKNLLLHVVMLICRRGSGFITHVQSHYFAHETFRWATFSLPSPAWLPNNKCCAGSFFKKRKLERCLKCESQTCRPVQACNSPSHPPARLYRCTQCSWDHCRWKWARAGVGRGICCPQSNRVASWVHHLQRRVANAPN